MANQSIPETELQLLIVADNLLTRAGLAALLEDQGSVIAGQSDGTALSDDIDIFQPDILVVDMGWRISPMQTRLTTIDNDLPLLVLITGDDNEEELTSLMQSLSGFSVYGVLLRDSDPNTIRSAVSALDCGLLVIDPSLSTLLNLQVNRATSPLAISLTPRENEVLQLLSKGMTNKAIALHLDITQHTVKFHVNAIMGKLDAQSRTEAVVRATQLGLIML